MLCASPLLAHETPTASGKAFPSFLKERMSQLLDKSKVALMQDKHSVALQTLDALTKLITDNQTAIVASFFPEFHNGFKTQKQALDPSDPYNSEGSYGVIFSRTYTNSQQHSLILNVIHFDPSIDEYWALINSPKLVKNLENTQVITIKDSIKALKKHSIDRQYIEYNIVPSRQLLISIVGNGFDSTDTLDQLVGEIDFQGLLHYLSN